MTASVCASCNHLRPIMLTVVDVVFGREYERLICSRCFRAERKERAE